MPKFEVGQRVEVSTRPYPATGPTVRDASGGWGFALNEWREATGIASSATSGTGCMASASWTSVRGAV